MFIHKIAIGLLKLERRILSRRLKIATNDMSKKGTIPQFSAQLCIRENLLFRLVELNRFLDIRRN